MPDNRKEFSQKRYNEADKKAKQTIINYLKPMNYTLIDASENFSFDLACYISDQVHSFHEVEIKHQWKDTWPDSWKEIRIPFRKIKLITLWKEKYPNCLLSFYVLNHFCTKAWHIKGNVVETSEVKEVSNRLVKQGEKFFHIKVNDANLLEDLKYEKENSN